MLLVCLSVALSLQAQSTKSKERSIQDWEEFSNYTLRLAEAMPEESYDYRPHPDQMSFGEQIIEIATMSEFFFARIVGRTANFSQGQIPEKMLRFKSQRNLSRFASAPSEA